MKARFDFSQNEEKWLQKQYKKYKTTKELTAAFNAAFDSRRSYDTIRHKARAFGMKRKTNLSDEQNEWLKEAMKVPGTTWKDITDGFEKRFGERRSQDTIRVHCRSVLGLVLVPRASDADRF